MKIGKFLSVGWISMVWCTLGGAELSEPRPPVPEVDLPFPVGEKLIYTIYWGWVEVGESVATTEWTWKEDAWKLSIQFRTTSNGVLSLLYPVDDTVQTLVDPVTLQPLEYRMDLRQGDRHRDEITRFDWANLQAHYVRVREDREDEVKTYAIKEDTRDIVSFMYFLRNTVFEENQTYDFEVMADEKLYDLTVNTKGVERIRLDAFGRVPSLRMDPLAEFQGVVNRRGKMRVWMTVGGRQIISKILVDTPFANVRLLLKTVEGPGADTWMEKAHVGPYDLLICHRDHFGL